MAKKSSTTALAKAPGRSPWRFSINSEAQLKTVKPQLAAVMRRALELSPIDFRISEGKRSAERQALLFAHKATRTLNSRHLTGDAVDVAAVVGGQVRWDWPLYGQIAAAVKLAARELNTKITWGGDWSKFKDGPHFELQHGD